MYQYNIDDYEGKTVEDIVNDLARTTGISVEENKSVDEKIRAAEKTKDAQIPDGKVPEKTNSLER